MTRGLTGRDAAERIRQNQRAAHAIGMREPSGSALIYDRSLLLSEQRRNDILALWEIQRYGRDSFGDPDCICIYGLRPADWYARGIRILARTAVECMLDRLADLIACDIAAVARTAPAVSGSVVVDPFAGSGNMLYEIDPPGRNHGLLLGTRGWTVNGEPFQAL